MAAWGTAKMPGGSCTSKLNPTPKGSGDYRMTDPNPSTQRYENHFSPGERRWETAYFKSNSEKVDTEDRVPQCAPSILATAAWNSNRRIVFVFDQAMPAVKQYQGLPIK